MWAELREELYHLCDLSMLTEYRGGSLEVSRVFHSVVLWKSLARCAKEPVYWRADNESIEGMKLDMMKYFCVLISFRSRRLMVIHQHQPSLDTFTPLLEPSLFIHPTNTNGNLLDHSKTKMLV